MDLILWRHAEAEVGEPDLGRKLTGKGEKQARRMAQWLHAHLPDSTRVLASPAIRAQQTAHALLDISHRKLRTREELAPGASMDNLLAVAEWPSANRPVLIVGHQPTLGWVVGHLLGTGAHEWPMRKGAVWWLQSRAGSDQASLRAVIQPDLA